MPCIVLMAISVVGSSFANDSRLVLQHPWAFHFNRDDVLVQFLPLILNNLVCVFARSHHGIRGSYRAKVNQLLWVAAP